MFCGENCSGSSCYLVGWIVGAQRDILNTEDFIDFVLSPKWLDLKWHLFGILVVNIVFVFLGLASILTNWKWIYKELCAKNVPPCTHSWAASRLELKCFKLDFMDCSLWKFRGLDSPENICVQSIKETVVQPQNQTFFSPVSPGKKLAISCFSIQSSVFPFFFLSVWAKS